MVNQQKLIEYIFSNIERKIPVSIIAQNITSDLELGDQLFTTEQVEMIIGQHVYDTVHNSYAKNLHQAIKTYMSINNILVGQDLFKRCYSLYLDKNVIQSRIDDQQKDRIVNVARYNTVPEPENQNEHYKSLLTHSNIDEDKLRISNNLHRNKLKRYSQELVKYKSIFELFDNIKQELKDFDINYNYSTPLLIEQKYSDQNKNADLIAMWSDHHFGEVVRTSGVNGINEYNLSIAYGRFQELVKKTIEKYIQYSKIYNVETVYIDVIGDMFSGDIHEDLQLSNEQRTTLVVTATSLMVAQGINELLKYIPKIVISGSYGNHSRLTEKKTFKSHIDNYDYMFLQILSAFFPDSIKQGRIKFNLEQHEFHLHERRGFNFLLEHGDNFKSIKMANMERELEGRILVFSKAGLKIPDYIEIGHFHQETEFTNKGLYVNGSLKGTDEYVFHRWKAHSKPSQKLMILTDDGIQETINLYLSTNPEKMYDFDFNKNPVIGELYASFM